MVTPIYWRSAAPNVARLFSLAALDPNQGGSFF